MQVKVILSALSLVFSAACSSSSGDAAGSGVASGSSGTSTGSPTSRGGASGASSMPNLDVGSLPGAGGGATLSPGGAAATPDVQNGECAQQNFLLSSKPADVLLVLDRSKSMIEHTVPPEDQTRWDAVVAGMTQVITDTDATISWGLKLFPEGEGSECVASSVTDQVLVEIAAMNAAKVNAAIMDTQAEGNGTPTGDAILKATEYLQQRKVSGQYLVLATDGQPSCPKGSDDALAYAVDAISKAKAAGFPTYVIGVVDPDEDKSTPKRLNAMAEAGGTARSDAGDDKYYQAYSQAALTSALQAITGQVVSCVFQFDAPPPDPSNIAVKVNGQRVDEDPNRSNGWAYTDDQFSGLELFGQPCEDVKDATTNQVDIIFGCKGKPIR